ncbi:hypothetical protein BsWGS_09256 [Bradybaena similaris]
MDVHVCVLLLWSFHTVIPVTPFEISRHQEDSSDLLKAVAAFQRLKHYVSPEYMLDAKPLTGEDVSSWLSTSDIHHVSSNSDDDAVGISQGQHLLHYASVLKRSDLPNNKQLDMLTLAPAKEELRGIFDVSENQEDKTVYEKFVEPNRGELLKEQTSNVGAFKITEAKKAAESEIKKTDERSSASQYLSLDTLDKEELKTLIKAIEKLRKQSDIFSSEPSEVPVIKPTAKQATGDKRAPDTILVAHSPINGEHNLLSNNLKSRLVKEVIVFPETIPDSHILRRTDKEFVLNNMANKTHVLNNIDVDLINDLISDVEDNLAQEVEHDIQATNKNVEVMPSDRRIIGKKNGLQHNRFAALNGNRIGDASLAFRDLLNAGGAILTNTGQNDVFDSSEQKVSLPAEKIFAKKMLELQDEVDKLTMIVKLEELENSILTDALNEASLGQEEGTVSSLEFDSLKQAIRVEEALHDLKRHQRMNHKPGDMKKRKLFERKRDAHSFSKGDIFSEVKKSYTRGRQVTKDDFQRLLGQVYLLKDQEEKESGTETISSSPKISTDECPPVPDGNTVCSWIDLDSVPADVKAKSLCGWKNMCCGCQSRNADTFHLGRKKCDLILEAVVSALCQNENCPLNSENLPTTKTTSYHQHIPLIFSHNGGQTGPDFWTCRKDQQVGVWICGYCQSVGR